MPQKIVPVTYSHDKTLDLGSIQDIKNLLDKGWGIIHQTPPVVCDHQFTIVYTLERDKYDRMGQEIKD